jgi:hypothetical protein
MNIGARSFSFVVTVAKRSSWESQKNIIKIEIELTNKRFLTLAFS